MHVPDHFLDAPTSAATAALAVGGIALAYRRSARELPDDTRVPAAALVATFVFAAQMLNFQVGSGTSGHLLGGALAAVIVGPATAALCVSAVLVVQAVVFADGGVTALGTNVVLMAFVGVLVGWGVTRLALRLMPARAASVPGASAAPTLAPDGRVVTVLVRRLLEAGTCDDDVVVVASAGSSDDHARACFEEVARDLSAAIGQIVPVGYVGGTGRPLDDVVADARADGVDRRVVVSSLLMAPGFFHDRIAEVFQLLKGSAGLSRRADDLFDHQRTRNAAAAGSAR